MCTHTQALPTRLASCIAGTQYTFILPASKALPSQMVDVSRGKTRHRTSVGVRWSADPVAKELLDEMGGALLATSVHVPEHLVSSWLAAHYCRLLEAGLLAASRSMLGNAELRASPACSSAVHCQGLVGMQRVLPLRSSWPLFMLAGCRNGAGAGQRRLVRHVWQ